MKGEDNQNPKMGFANTIAILDLGATAYSSMGECMRFGMVSGCAEDCPVFERGECEQQEENEKIFNEERKQDD